MWRADSGAVAYRAPDQSATAIPVFTTTLDGRAIAPFANGWDRHFVEEDEQIVEVTRSGRRVISDGADRYIAPLRSFDGTYVAYMGLTTGLYVYSLVDERTVYLGPGAHAMFSPDERYLVFVRSEDEGHRIVASDLWIADLGDQRIPCAPLLEEESIDRMPTLTADRLAFVRTSADVGSPTDESDGGTDELVLAKVVFETPGPDTDATDALGAGIRHDHGDGRGFHWHPAGTPTADEYHITLSAPVDDGSTSR